jgi:hypothetical protein
MVGWVILGVVSTFWALRPPAPLALWRCPTGGRSKGATAMALLHLQLYHQGGPIPNFTHDPPADDLGAPSLAENF